MERMLKFMMTAGTNVHRGRLHFRTALWLLATWPLAIWAAAPPPVLPSPADLSSNITANADLFLSMA